MAKWRLKVFISYARSDQAKAHDLYKRLISDGLDAWIDKENLLPGQDWELEIRKFLRKTDVVVVCLSEKFNRAGFRQKEVRLALDSALEKPEGEIFIIPARLEKCDNLESLRKWNWVDLFGDGGYENLMRALRQRASEIDAAMPQIPAQGNFETVQVKVAKKTRKRIPKPKKVLKDTQSGKISKVEGRNQSIVILGDVIGSNLISGNENEVETSGRSDSGSETKMEIPTRSERLVSDRVLRSWLNVHGLVANPFGDVDLKSYPYYPEGAARPNQWEAFLDPIPLFALCLNSEDAQTLSYLLRKECFPLSKKDMEAGTKRWIFPLWVSHQQTAPMQSPLLTLAQSAAQTWLDILPPNPVASHELSPAGQNALLELLRWSLGSANAIINLLQNNGLGEDANGLSLIRKIEKFEKEITMPTVPHDAVLLSWLKLRPPDHTYTYLILPLDGLPVSARSLWFEQFSSLIPMLFLNGIVTKAFSSPDVPGTLPLAVIRLDWSDARLKASLDSQFNHAVEIDNETNRREKEIKFNQLFGPFGSVTEQETADRLISASRNSLARMLMLGNRLLQFHCENRKKDGVPEKHLYVEDLEAILNTP